jgi:hypothetical protein
MNLISIPAFQDNYIWVLSEENGRCLIVDPGEAAPVLAAIEKSLAARSHFVDPHHHDHVGGVKQLREKFPLLWFTDRQKPRIKAPLTLWTTAIGCRFWVTNFLFFHARSHFRTHLFLQRTLSFLWRYNVFRRLRKAFRRNSRADVSIIYENKRPS